MRPDESADQSAASDLDIDPQTLARLVLNQGCNRDGIVGIEFVPRNRQMLIRASICFTPTFLPLLLATLLFTQLESRFFRIALLQIDGAFTGGLLHRRDGRNIRALANRVLL